MMLDTGPNHPGAGKASRWLLIKRSDGLDVPGRAARHPRDCLSALTPSLARAGNFIPTLLSLGHANAQSKKRSIGCTFCARQIVSGAASDRPR